MGHTIVDKAIDGLSYALLTLSNGVVIEVRHGPTTGKATMTLRGLTSIYPSPAKTVDDAIEAVLAGKASSVRLHKWAYTVAVFAPWRNNVHRQ
jgi:hypothetical protein